MNPINPIFWLTILSFGGLLEAQLPNFDDDEEISACPGNVSAVCGEAYRSRGGIRSKQTFKNQCEFDRHNRLFGDPYYKLKDGPCDPSDCPRCNNDVNPVCHSMGSQSNNNRGFRNSCYAERYKCLHGQNSVSIKMKDGRCEICDQLDHSRNSLDDREKTWVKNNLEWQSRVINCRVDNSPLIAE